MSWSVFTTGNDEDDLVLLGDRRDRRAFGRRERAEKEIDILAQDQVARDTDSLVGIALGVADDQLDLATEHAALGVDLLDEHLRALQRGLTDERAGSGQDHRIAHPDCSLLRCSRTRKGDAGYANKRLASRNGHSVLPE